LSAGCERWTFYPEFIAHSPDGAAEVRILRNFPSNGADYGYRVEVVTGGVSDVIYSQPNGASLGLVEVHWTPSNDKLGLFVCNMQNGFIELSYDLKSRKSLSGPVFLEDINRQIATRYSLAPETDVLRWACSNSGNLAYRRVR
jgi:hypothetical protein